MKALTYLERGRFAVTEKPKPVVTDPRDAVVRGLGSTGSGRSMLSVTAWPTIMFVISCASVSRVSISPTN